MTPKTEPNKQNINETLYCPMNKLLSTALLLLILCGCGDDEINLPFTEPETDWNLSYSEMEERYQGTITESLVTDENIVLGDFSISAGSLTGVSALLYTEKNGIKTMYYFNKYRKLICSEVIIKTDEDISELLEKKYGTPKPNGYTWENGNCLIGVYGKDGFWGISYANPTYATTYGN